MRMGDLAAMPGTADWMLPPEGDTAWREAHRFGASGLTPPPARSAADAYRMGGLAATDQYKPNTWRDIDRKAIEEQYGGADIHGIKLPPVSKDEPRAWRDTIIGETPADALVNWGLGGSGRLAKGALALGGLFKATDPAEAGVLGKLLRGGTGGPHPGGIHVYHSSPHDFDRFDWGKLRTGEGANVYGSGFYFAENPAVSGQGGEYWNQFLRRFPKNEQVASELLSYNAFEREQAIRKIRESIERSKPELAENRLEDSAVQYEIRKRIERQQNALDVLESNQPIVGPRTYEVNIAARPELMLDWDKPLSKQPQIVEKLPALVEGAGREAYDRALAATSKPRADELWGMAKDPLQATGEFAYGRLAPRDYNRASDMLREAGIPGIRYLDQGSRNQVTGIDELLKTYGSRERIREVAQQYPSTGADSGFWSQVLHRLDNPPTYNYVVTDPSKLDILAKYGIVSTAGGMGALAAQDRYQQ